ncbi:MAG TPA: 16S rRNA (adenine(1518)-N(6)/adenine(1519)-N(6))-dimethyltransferase RsmA [Polyangiales bacterium]|nr:16S rRNA (adenine(1518)-N(6)/adenine(1519)-N(6))-dimethyltransferase RsmA [Polyangiales bacterium]
MSSTWEDPRRVLARHGLAPKRSFSQNFLVSERAVRGIVEACGLDADSHVVELGPGCGTLTVALAAACARVYAVERDPDMLHLLEQETDPARVQLVPGDAKEVDLRALSGGARIHVAGNLPYAITGAILRRLCEQSELISNAVLMVQREVRDRLVAAPDTSEYGALTVFTQQVFEIKTVLHVPRTAFHPPPKVTSSVVKLTPLSTPRAPRVPSFEQIVRAAFQARRKTLRNALIQSLGSERSDAILAAAGIDGKRRGETLSIEEYAGLSSALDALNER